MSPHAMRSREERMTNEPLVKIAVTVRSRVAYRLRGELGAGATA